jgi:hypothetical protein
MMRLILINKGFKQMRILFIGNKGQRTYGLQYYSCDNIIFQGLIEAGHNAYFFSDRDELQQCKKLGIIRWGAKRTLNKKVLTLAKNFKPDMVLLSHVNLINNATLTALRQQNPDLRIAQLVVDAIYTPKNNAYLKSRVGFVDSIFITTGGPALAEFGLPQAPVYFIPNFTSHTIDEFKSHTKSRNDLQFDVCYFAHATRPNRDDFGRIQLARDLKSNISGLRCAYAGFDKVPSMRGINFMATLGQSAMALNMSRRVVDHWVSTPETRYLYSSDRIARQMSNGLLTFIENGFELDKLYPKDAVVFFDDINDLTEKVTYYLEHDAERQKIAANGYNFVHQHMCAKTCVQYIIERTMGLELSQNYVWPTTGFFDA